MKKPIVTRLINGLAWLLMFATMHLGPVTVQCSRFRNPSIPIAPYSNVRNARGCSSAR
jgi:hypothetical protein